jgi:hypothetical protein
MPQFSESDPHSEMHPPGRRAEAREEATAAEDSLPHIPLEPVTEAPAWTKEIRKQFEHAFEHFLDGDRNPAYHLTQRYAELLKAHGVNPSDLNEVSQRYKTIGSPQHPTPQPISPEVHEGEDRKPQVETDPDFLDFSFDLFSSAFDPLEDLVPVPIPRKDSFQALLRALRKHRPGFATQALQQKEETLGLAHHSEDIPLSGCDGLYLETSKPKTQAANGSFIALEAMLVVNINTKRTAILHLEGFVSAGQKKNYTPKNSGARLTVLTSDGIRVGSFQLELQKCSPRVKRSLLSAIEENMIEGRDSESSNREKESPFYKFLRSIASPSTIRQLQDALINQKNLESLPDSQGNNLSLKYKHGQSSTPWKIPCW